ncbi:MAG: hypothetical protein HN576_12060 [Bacteriovoracaceae bacterium]|jgi:hypothetical protein|nr:hypothetical protein [Bacteriovoracaceae bacterium]
MGQIVTSLKRLLTSVFKQDQFRIQTFTYFIPAPSPRKTGYREKRFDKLFYKLINLGYEIIDFKTQQCSNRQETSGMWLIFVLRAKNAKAEELNFDEFGLLDMDNCNSDVISHSHSDTEDLATHKANSNHEEEITIALPETAEEYGNKIKGLYQIKEK